MRWWWWCWGASVVGIVLAMGLGDLVAAVDIDRVCMQSGLLGRFWKNKHCNNAARELESGPFALLDLSVARITEFRVWGYALVSGLLISLMERIGARRRVPAPRLSRIEETPRWTVAPWRSARPPRPVAVELIEE